MDTKKTYSEPILYIIKNINKFFINSIQKSGLKLNTISEF